MVLSTLREEAVGEKFCLSDAFLPAPDPLRKFKIPAYDNYKIMFTACDNFNRALHDRKWPHKRDWKKTRRELGHQHTFAMAVVLQNTFNLFKKDATFAKIIHASKIRVTIWPMNYGKHLCRCSRIIDV